VFAKATELTGIREGGDSALRRRSPRNVDEFGNGSDQLRQSGEQQGDVRVIALTLRRDRIDNFWFTLIHELAHVARHLTDDRKVILDDLEISSSEAIEQNADEMAMVALIPNEVMAAFRGGVFTSLSDIEDLARRAGVNPAIAAGRWQKEHRDFRKFSKLLAAADTTGGALAGVNARTPDEERSTDTP
jgi:hypothetical protein